MGQGFHFPIPKSQLLDSGFDLGFGSFVPKILEQLDPTGRPNRKVPDPKFFETPQGKPMNHTAHRQSPFIQCPSKFMRREGLTVD
jgi:hypothetical protein